MPRKPHLDSSEYPFLVGGRCINRDWFALPMDEVWSIMSDHLYFLNVGFQVKIHVFVLMSNHFHLIVSTPLANLSKAMAYFMCETSRWLTFKSGRINQCWGGRFGRTLLDRNIHFLNTYKYIYRNPVKAKICDQVEQYPYSSLFGLLGQAPIFFPVEPDATLFDDCPKECLKWLNRQPPSEHEDAIKLALSRRKFKLPKIKNKTPHPLETALL